MGFRQFFGKDWIHVVSEESNMWDLMEYAQDGYDKMLSRVPKYVESLEVCFEAWGCVMQTHLHQLTLHTQAMCVGSQQSHVHFPYFSVSFVVA